MKFLSSAVPIRWYEPMLKDNPAPSDAGQFREHIVVPLEPPVVRRVTQDRVERLIGKREPCGIGYDIRKYSLVRVNANVSQQAVPRAHVQ
jgi:hypothetical protein